MSATCIPFPPPKSVDATTSSSQPSGGERGRLLLLLRGDEVNEPLPLHPLVAQGRWVDPLRPLRPRRLRAWECESVRAGERDGHTKSEREVRG